MRFCPTCGHTLTDAEHFCPQCGSAVAAPPPPPPMYTPPVYTAPVSPLVNDLKACAVGLSVSGVCLLLSIVNMLGSYGNEWIGWIAQLLSGGMAASLAFAAANCRKACAWISAIPWFCLQLVVIAANIGYYVEEAAWKDWLLFLVGRIIWTLVPIAMVLIVGVWRKRRSRSTVQPMAVLLIFGLEIAAAALQGLVQILAYEMDVSNIVGLNGILNVWEIVGFAAVYVVSWCLLKSRNRRLCIGGIQS